MKRSFTPCAALGAAACVTALVAWNPVSATTRDRTLAVIYPLPAVGIAATQLMQVNVANVSRVDADASRTMLVVQARLLNAQGVELARSERQTLALGATFSWKITSAELTGSPGDDLGRRQVRAEIGVLGTLRVGAFVPSLELIDGSTGANSGVIGDIRTVISAQAAYASANAGWFD
jgi:hypothetical protein